ncbi:MAG: T9SS type A sorting domain-containing protein [Ignavibacteriaceae bacterium]|nr:T9SS type A sorting domain-containing protein [Ignavibacteriaceae bacterium]
MTSPAGALQMSVEITVPVELSLFEGYYQNGKNILYWITSSEMNNRGFEIERNDLREDGAYGSWITVGYVQGAGTSAEINRYNFSDDKITGAKYIYRLKQIDFDGTVSYSKRVNIQSELPYDFTLEQNYPNPFSTTTKIKFTIPTLGLGGTDEGLGGSAQGSGTIGTSGDVPVTLKLYDLLGREVATLVNETKSPGAYEVTLDLSGSLSGEISSGMYFYRLESGNNTITRKMIVIK